jgi:hypothetical protein
MGRANPRSDRAKEPDPQPLSQPQPLPLYLDPGALQQLVGDIAGDAVDPSLLRPTGDDAEDRALARRLLLDNLRHDLDQARIGSRLRAAVDTYAPSAADIEALSTVEFHLGKAIEALCLTATDAEGRAAARRLFLLLLQCAQEPELVEDALRAVQSLHGWANDYRRCHPPINQPGRPGEEAKTWLVGELLRIFAKRFGFLEAHLKPQEFARRRNLFMVRAIELLKAPLSRNAIKKRRRGRPDSS